MKCPECKKGKMVYHPEHFYASCSRCDYRNGAIDFIRQVRGDRTTKNAKMKKKVRLEIRVPPVLRKWLVKQAKVQKEQVSTMIARALKQAVKCSICMKDSRRDSHRGV
jgi:hypothetical protein